MKDIHNYRKRLERIIRKIENSCISKRNRKIIMQFHDFCFSQGLSIAKIERYLFDLHKFAQMLKKDLSKATKQDIQSIIAKVERSEWSPHTKHGFKVLVKKFYKWLEGIDEKGIYPERVRWINTTIKSNKNKLPEELLDESEINKMIRQCRDERDRAFISVLYESGCRISEIGTLRIKDISFDRYGARISISGKTGARIIRVISSVPYLQEWLNKHPSNDDPNSYVWIKKKSKELLSYTRLSAILRKAGKRAGIKKRIYPHLLRHSRATYLAKHLTEAQIKEYLGWTQSSRMPAIYVHLSGRDTDSAILKLYGIKLEDNSKETQELKPKVCARCNTSNEATNKFCKTCGMILDSNMREEIIKNELKREKLNRIMNELIKDAEFYNLLIKKVKERSIEI